MMNMVWGMVDEQVMMVWGIDEQWGKVKVMVWDIDEQWGKGVIWYEVLMNSEVKWKWYEVLMNSEVKWRWR